MTRTCPLSHIQEPSAFHYHNPLVILLAVILLVLFSRIKFSSRIINKLAKAAFTCYLINYGILCYLNVGYYIQQPAYIMLAHLSICIIGIYLMSWCCYNIYTIIMSPISRFINKYSISYFVNHTL